MRNKRFIIKLENLLNKSPNIGVIMVIATILLVILSAILSKTTGTILYFIVDPVTLDKQQMQFEILSYFDFKNFTDLVSNSFVVFANMTTTISVLVTLIAFGIAEKSGFLYTIFKKLLFNVPKYVVTFVLVFVGIMSNVVSTGDLNPGYLVLLPISAFIFMGNGRNPLAGLAAMFASIFAGFSINMLVSSNIADVTAITRQISSEYLSDFSNVYNGSSYVMIALVIVGTITITLLTEKYIVNILPIYDLEVYTYHRITQYEKRGLIAIVIYTVLALLVYTYLLLPKSVIDMPYSGFFLSKVVNENGYLTQFLNSKFVSSFVIHISYYFIIAGTLFGIFSKKFTSLNDVVKSAVVSVADHAEYFVFTFIMAQMLYVLYSSGISLYAQLMLAKLLSSSSGSATSLVVVVILITAVANLLIPSATTKWQVLAPIAVPLFITNAINPMLAQTAFQIGDSFTNTISFVMPYTIFAYVLFHIYSVKTKQHFGNGTFLKLTAPYSLMLGAVWTVTLIIWIMLNANLAPDINIFI